MLRLGLALVGVLMVGSGLSGLLLPEVIYSEGPGLDATLLRLVNVGVIGYGVLLIVSPSYLAGSPWTAFVLTSAVLAYGIGLVLMSLQATEPLSSALRVAALMVPAIVQLALATSVRRTR